MREFHVWFWRLRRSRHGHEFRWGLHYHPMQGLYLTDNAERSYRNIHLWGGYR